MTTAAKTNAAAYSTIPVELVDESPLNPRKAFDAEELELLTQSVREKGIVVPVLVRPKGDRYELVYGHRRLRAAKAAGLTHLPATIRELDDKQVLEVAILENCTRADIHPLEEGAAYRELHEKHGYTADEIAAKVGKSRETIYARMKLCALDGKAREALLEGKLSASVGVLLARIPNDELREKAATEMLRWRGYDGGPVSYRQAADFLERDFMVRLADASFDRKDAELVPKAGACTACPKRSSAQPELFADVKSGDVCTDPPCFREKLAVHSKRVLADAEASGRTVLSPAESEKASYHGGGFVRLDEKCWQDPKQRTYKKLLGKHAPPPAIGVRKDGTVFEVLREKEAAKALEAAGHDFAKRVQRQAAASSSSSSYEEKRKREQAIKRAATKAAITAVVEAAERTKPDAKFWRMLAYAAVDLAWHDTAVDVVKRRELEVPKGERPEEVLDALVEKLNCEQQRALIIEMVVTKGAYFSYQSGHTDRFEDALDLYGLSYKDFEAQAKASAKEAAAAKKAKKPKGKKAAPAKTSKKKAKATPGVCSSCGCTEDNACEGGCYWANADETLCSSCASAEDES